MQAFKPMQFQNSSKKSSRLQRLGVKHNPRASHAFSKENAPFLFYSSVNPKPKSGFHNPANMDSSQATTVSQMPRWAKPVALNGIPNSLSSQHTIDPPLAPDPGERSHEDIFTYASTDLPTNESQDVNPTPVIPGDGSHGEQEDMQGLEHGDDSKSQV